MKKLWMIVPVFAFLFLLLYACEKDTFAPADQPAGQEEVTLRVPDVHVYHIIMRTEGVVQNPEPTNDCGLPATGYVTGHFSHMGQLRAEESTWEIVGCSVVPTSVGMDVYNEVYGQWVAANGDKLLYHGNMVLNLQYDPETGFTPFGYDAQGDIYDGTGRFEDAEGTFHETHEAGDIEGEAVIYVPK